jgi:hypothetical protein
VSLDIFVACAAAVSLPSDLPTDITWKTWKTGSFTADKPNSDWSVEVWLVNDPKQLDQMHLPPGTRQVVAFSLGGNDDEGFALLERVYEAVYTKCDGTLLDF